MLKKTIACLALPLLISLTACGGGGDMHKPLKPQAFYTFGDGLVDAGWNGGKIFSVNPADGSASSDAIPHRVASYFGLSITPQNQGGHAWGQGHSTVANTQAQITDQIALGKFGANDVVLLSAGMEDIIAATEQVLAGTLSDAQAKQQVQTAAQNLSAQWGRLKDNGAQYIYLIPPYDLASTPWMVGLQNQYTNQNPKAIYDGLDKAFSDTLNREAETFARKNSRVLLKTQNIRVIMGLLVDGEDRDGVQINTTDKALCAAPADKNASLCTKNTLVEPEEGAQGKYLFADDHHPTPGPLAVLASRVLQDMSDIWTD